MSLNIILQCSGLARINLSEVVNMFRGGGVVEPRGGMISCLI